MTKVISLSQGKVALVDDDDYERIKNIKFYTHHHCNKWYARCSTDQDKKAYLHTLLLNPNINKVCDHINGDGLDNRRCNLRIVTVSQNLMNSSKPIRKSSSCFKGVCWHKDTKKWQSQIKLNGCSYYLGLFQNEVDAAKAYDDAAILLFGEYAKLNLGRIAD